MQSSSSASFSSTAAVFPSLRRVLIFHRLYCDLFQAVSSHLGPAAALFLWKPLVRGLRFGPLPFLKAPVSFLHASLSGKPLPVGNVDFFSAQMKEARNAVFNAKADDVRLSDDEHSVSFLSESISETNETPGFFFV